MISAAGVQAKAISARARTLNAVPATIQGRRRPQRVRVRSESQPAISGTSSAKTPPAAVARPTRASLAFAPTSSLAPSGMRATRIGCQCAPLPNQKALMERSRPRPRRAGGVTTRAGAVGSAVAVMPGWSSREWAVRSSSRRLRAGPSGVAPEPHRPAGIRRGTSPEIWGHCPPAPRPWPPLRPIGTRALHPTHGRGRRPLPTDRGSRFAGLLPSQT